MDTTNQLITSHSNEWTSILLGLLFLVGLYYLQRYLYKLDELLLKNEASKTIEKQKPWSLWIAILLGFSVFLYGVFSPNDLILIGSDWSIFLWMILILLVVTIVGLFVQSLMHFGTKKGLLRSFIYLVLITVYFYAGFISGLLVIGLIALFVLLFFFKYFKNLLTIK